MCLCSGIQFLSVCKLVPLDQIQSIDLFAWLTQFLQMGIFRLKNDFWPFLGEKTSDQQEGLLSMVSCSGVMGAPVRTQVQTVQPPPAPTPVKCFHLALLWRAPLGPLQKDTSRNFFCL